MTIKEVFVRFSLTYIALIIALSIINKFLTHYGISPISSIGYLLLFLSTGYPCDAFVKKNKRYFTPEEKKKVIIGFIIINLLIDGILLSISGMANRLGANVLLITLGILVIMNPLLIYIFVGLTGLGAMKRYGIKKDEAALNNNKHDDKVIQNENEYAKEAMRTLWAFWVLSVMSLLVFLYVGYAAGNPSNPRFSLESMRIVLSVLLIMTLLFTYLLRKRLLTMRNKVASSTISVNTSLSDQTLFARKYLVAVLISFLFSFLIAIYGIILFYSGSDYLTYCVFLAISFISLCYFRPKRAEFNNMVSALQQEGSREMLVE
jgi:hypothetical protein